MDTGFTPKLVRKHSEGFSLSMLSNALVALVRTCVANLDADIVASLKLS